MAFCSQIGALTIFCEASGEPDEGKAAVAWTFINRMQLNPKRYGRTVAAVCLKRYQYSEWNDDAGDNANLLRGAEASDDEPVMQDCLSIMGGVLNGSIADPTGGATHYFADYIAAPPWAEGATLCCKIGHHSFYKDVQ